MTTLQIVFEFVWMILFSSTAFFLGLAIIKKGVFRSNSKNCMLLFLGCFVWTIGYSIDSIGTFVLSGGSWMVDGGGTTGDVREILSNLRIVCSLIGCIFVLISAMSAKSKL